MNRDSIQPPGPADLPRRSHLPPRSRRERVLVLGPLGLAGAAAFCGVPEGLLAPLCLAALAWTVLASLGLALVSGLRDGDWSAFLDRDHAEDREEETDLDLRVGAYAFMREREQRMLSDHNDRLH